MDADRVARTAYVDRGPGAAAADALRSLAALASAAFTATVIAVLVYLLGYWLPWIVTRGPLPALPQYTYDAIAVYYIAPMIACYAGCRLKAGAIEGAAHAALACVSVAVAVPAIMQWAWSLHQSEYVIEVSILAPVEPPFRWPIVVFFGLLLGTAMHSPQTRRVLGQDGDGTAASQARPCGAARRT